MVQYASYSNDYTYVYFNWHELHESDVCSNHQDGNTALHVAAKKRADESRCVVALLFHPGIDTNIKNNEGQTAMMDAGIKSLGVFKQITKICNNFPTDYGNVVLCGNLGVGKSTLTQVSCVV